MESFCETNWLGFGNDIKEILKFYKNELNHKQFRDLVGTCIAPVSKNLLLRKIT